MTPFVPTSKSFTMSQSDKNGVQVFGMFIKKNITKGGADYKSYSLPLKTVKTSQNYKHNSLS